MSQQHLDGIEHVPVLLREVLAVLGPRSGGIYIDGTVGGGGHASAILEASGPDGRLLGLDADASTLGVAEARLSPFGDRVTLVHSSYVDLERVARTHGFAGADGILLDLGFSSLQISDPERGFSFALDGELDMRFDRSIGPTARELVNNLPEKELVEILRSFGEEPKATSIVRAIARERAIHPIETSLQLAELVSRVVPRHGSKTHPATRTFQALRIAVNRELENVASVVESAIDMLAPLGVLAIITFHSLEDRLVKHAFLQESRSCICPKTIPVCVCGHQPRIELLTKKPTTPSLEEAKVNPRSRSAKLRAVRRLAPAISA